MYNKDLNKANKANKGFMCKALPVVRYILLALIYNGVLLHGIVARIALGIRLLRFLLCGLAFLYRL